MWLCQVFDGMLLKFFLKKSLPKGIWNANEKARKMKKIFCFNICSCHYLRQNSSTSDLSFSQVTSVEKREPRKHFSASAFGLGFKNFFLGTLFSTSVTWEKLKSDVDKLCLRRVKNKYRNKILYFEGSTVLDPVVFFMSQTLFLCWFMRHASINKACSSSCFCRRCRECHKRSWQGHH